MTSMDLFSLSEEFIFLNRFTRSVIYAGVISVDMSPQKLDDTKINLSNPSKTFLRHNFLGELKEPLKHIHWLHGLWKTRTTAWQEELNILGFLAKILDYKYKNWASFNWGIATKIRLITCFFSNIHSLSQLNKTNMFTKNISTQSLQSHRERQHHAWL